MLLVIWANALSMLASSSSGEYLESSKHQSTWYATDLYDSLGRSQQPRFNSPQDWTVSKIGPIASRVVGSFEPLQNFETTVIEETDARCTVNPWDKMEDYRGNWTQSPQIPAAVLLEVERWCASVISIRREVFPPPAQCNNPLQDACAVALYYTDFPIIIISLIHYEVQR